MKKQLLGVKVRCGRLRENPKIFVGGCGRWVDVMEMFRCTDCTVPFHRRCAQKHFIYPMKADEQTGLSTAHNKANLV